MSKDNVSKFYSAVARFWKYAEKKGPDECWPWHGPTIRDGRGVLTFGSDKRPLVAPRVSMLVHGMDLPETLFACHKCNNPNCVNPAHLYAGTVTDNNRDISRAGKMNGQSKTHCVHGHPLSGDNLFRDSAGHRKCRICQRASAERWEQRNRPIGSRAIRAAGVEVER